MLRLPQRVFIYYVKTFTFFAQTQNPFHFHKNVTDVYAETDSNQGNKTKICAAMVSKMITLDCTCLPLSFQKLQITKLGTCQNYDKLSFYTKTLQPFIFRYESMNQLCWICASTYLLIARKQVNPQ